MRDSDFASYDVMRLTQTYPFLFLYIVVQIHTNSLAKALPPEGGLGVLLCRRGCSLFAGHVGNMDGSIGPGASLKYSAFRPSSALIRRLG